TFSDMLSQTIRSATAPHDNYGGTNAIQVGLGMKLASVDIQFQQGTFESTGNFTDLAVQGEGFFVLSDGNQKFFTRSGAFNMDAEGYLTAQGGSMRVQGYMADQLGTLANNLAPSDIQVPFGMKAPASATTEMGLYCNLDAESTESTATLLSAGTTGVTMVSGEALNGAGGTYTLAILGSNATQGSGIGANTSGGPLVGTESLLSLGIDDEGAQNLTIEVDNSGLPVTIEGLTENSTVNNLIQAITDQVSGVTASLDVSGEVLLTRDFYGSAASIAAAEDPPYTGLNASIFDVVFGGSWTYTAGSDSDLRLDTTASGFLPNGSTTSLPLDVTFEADENTGLITGINGLGGGGVTIFAANGVAAGTMTLETEDTTHTTSIVTFDSLGGEHVVDITFTKTATPNLWDWEIGVEEPAQIISGNTGQVTFDNEGALESFTYDNGALSFSFNPNNGASPVVSIELDAGTIGGVDGMTQFASPTTTIVQSQDGYGMGELIDVFIDGNGTVLGSFSNDQTQTLAQIVLADFNNSQGLMKEGGNLYRASANTGDPMYGLAQTNFGSTIYSGYVEKSNVDLAKQFADMIVAQRGFQACSRVITTSDHMLEEITRLKRA
ncbi:flagellar hook-basal body complex protein, partial [bacterium]|nr:flagellar hook-basal body complex protein [bacterium]